jgi:hypothetical protein
MAIPTKFGKNKKMEAINGLDNDATIAKLFTGD